MTISNARCGVAPMPVEPNDSWLGRSRTNCTSSFIEVTGSDGLTTSTKATDEVSAIGVKSLAGSYGSFL